MKYTYEQSCIQFSRIIFLSTFIEKKLKKSKYVMPDSYK